MVDTTRMALFDLNDIAELKAIHQQKRNEWFAKTNEDHIDRELKKLTWMIRGIKSSILNDLKRKMYGLKTVEVEVTKARSFDFSKVGGSKSIYEHENAGWYNYMTYGKYASNWYPNSFLELDGRSVNRYFLWKSPDFLTKLAKELHLPENMYFVVRTKKVVDDIPLFVDSDVTEYVNTLSLVIRFSK